MFFKSFRSIVFYDLRVIDIRITLSDTSACDVTCLPAVYTMAARVQDLLHLVETRHDDGDAYTSQQYIVCKRAAAEEIRCARPTMHRSVCAGT